MSERDDEQVDRMLAALPERPAVGVCVEVEVLVRYRAQSLTEVEEEGVERHLVDCAECRVQLAALDEPVDELAARRAVQVIEAARAEARPASRWLRWGGAVAAAVLGVVLARGLSHPSEVVAMGYVLEGFQGVATEKGASEAPSAVFRPDTGVSWVLRPEHDVRVVPTLRLLVSRPGGPVEQVPSMAVGGAVDEAPMLVVQRGAQGAFRLRGRAEQVFRGEPGDYVVSFVVVSPDQRCEPMDGKSLDEARAGCPAAVYWRDVVARFER
jgi:hypothetical protein